MVMSASTHQSSSRASQIVLKWIAVSIIASIGVALLAKPVAQTDVSSSEQPDIDLSTDEPGQPHSTRITRLFPTANRESASVVTLNPDDEVASNPDRPTPGDSAPASPRLRLQSLPTAAPPAGASPSQGATSPQSAASQSTASQRTASRPSSMQGRSPTPSRASNRSVALAPPQLPLPEEADLDVADWKRDPS